MITVWNADSKYVTPLIKGPIVPDENGNYRIPLLKIEGNDECLNGKLEEFIETFKTQPVFVYDGAPTKNFNRDTLGFEVDPNSAIGVAQDVVIEDGVVFATLHSTQRAEYLQNLMNGSLWLDVCVPYLMLCERGGVPKVIKWANLVFIDIVPPSETAGLPLQ